MIGEDDDPPRQSRRQAQGQTPGQTQGQAQDDQKGRVRATPLIRRMAQELGVDLDSVEGTGPQGRITEDDVRRAGAGGRTRAGASRSAASGASSPSTWPARTARCRR